ncbi:MAG: XRE family transcriptional regulator [Clostridiales bacterium]|jgi:transcriptional regulator with XRE-family HTH domain|nr:XRE family transcriptional regulator [Clostridiales bacterium]DAH05834.1 MAG TPA: helix-turn-helix XRE-family like protein [Caudoviricetes sp.]
MVMRIKELRESAGMSQQELGSNMGVGRSTVKNWELEISLPLARDLPLLADVLGVNTIDELYCRED